MRKSTKTIGVSLALVCGAVATFAYTYDYQKHKPLIQRELNTLAGIPVSLEGNIEVKWSPNPTLVLNAISVANADWAIRENFLFIDRTEVTPSLTSLLLGSMKITEVVLNGVQVNLQTSQEGTPNWQAIMAQRVNSRPAGAATSSAISSDELPRFIGLNDLDLRFHSGLVELESLYEIDSASLSAPNAQEPALLAIFAASINGHPLSIEGTIGEPAKYLSNEQIEIALNGHYSDAKLSLLGEIAEPANLDGIALEFNADAETLNNFGAVVGGQGKYPLPKDQPVSASAKITRSSGSVQILDLEVRSGAVIIR